MEKELGWVPNVVDEPQQSKIITLAEHPKVRNRIKSADKADLPEESVLARVQRVVEECGDRQLSSFDHLYALCQTDRQIDNLIDLRKQRANITSNTVRGLLNEVGGMVHYVVLHGTDGRHIERSDEVVPWIDSPEDQGGGKKYLKAIEMLQKDKDIQKLITRYTPLRKELEALKNQEEYARRWNSLSHEEQTALMLVQDIRQMLFDHEILLRLFDVKKNPSFWSAFEKRKKISEKKLPAKKVESQLGGSQMTFNVGLDEGRIIIDTGSRTIRRIDGFTDTFSAMERKKFLGASVNSLPPDILAEVIKKFNDVESVKNT